MSMDTVKLLSPLIRNLAETRSIRQAKLIHQKIVTSGLQRNIALCKNLILIYFSCHLFRSARLVFRSIENPSDITLWNSIISSYTKSFKFREALEVFEELMRFSFLEPDSYTYPSVLKACNGLGLADFGRMIHARLVKRGFVADVVVGSSLLGMYAKCGMFGLAVKVFDEMPERDVACWNTVISCYHQGGQYEKAFDLFGKMKDHGYEPDPVTYATVISSCARLLNLERGKAVHKEAARDGSVSDGFVQAALVDMYGKCGCLETGVGVFERIPRKSLVAWNSMIVGYSLKGDSECCIRLLSRMNIEGTTKPNSTSLSSVIMACSKSANLKHGKSVHAYTIRNGVKADTFIHTSLVDMYFKCGAVPSAEHVFGRMPKTDVVEWNSMISGYVAAGSYLDALGTYGDMNVEPDAITFTSTLAACSQLAVLEMGRDVHKSVAVRGFESSEIVMGALLDMYTKCGAVDEARKIFERLPERDLISWTSMITAHGSHGQGSEAVRLFREMLDSDTKPDRVVFLAVISVCSHAGLVHEGCYYFNLMVHDYGIQPKTAEYSCLVDLLGRAGRLREAYGVLRRTANVKEDIGLLSTLFSACRLHGDSELWEEIAGLLIDKDPDDQSTYVVLANMYASVKKWDEARRLRMKMKELGLRKNPGCTWIEVDNKIEPFFVGDKSIPRADSVYGCLLILSGHMNEDELVLRNALSNV